MANDASYPLVSAIVSLLEANDTLFGVVGNEVYADLPTEPVWPFVRVGVPISIPFLSTGNDGANIDFDVSAFCRSQDREAAANLSALIARILDNTVLVLDTPYAAKAHIRWTRGTIVRDTTEQDAWHGVSSFNAVVIAQAIGY